MKSTRHLKILEIVNNYNVETQEELLSLLRREGFQATQATISRDIKELHLHKLPLENGSYKYVHAGNDGRKNDEKMKYQNVLCEVVLSAVPACNIGVIKTLSGTANAAGAALELMGYSEIIGTLAGDDTLLCLFASDKLAADFCGKMNYLYIGE